MNQYYAKSILKNGKHPTVFEHLTEVSQKAKEYGQIIGCGEEAGLAGLFHDFGKYSRDFSGVLIGKKAHVDHAVGGAAYLFRCCKETKYKRTSLGQFLPAEN